MARKLGIMVISDEVYSQTIYGENKFVLMGIFSSIAPVVTLGSISKGWLVPGWRIGWIAMNDPENVFKTTGVSFSICQLSQVIRSKHRPPDMHVDVMSMFEHRRIICCQ